MQGRRSFFDSFPEPIDLNQATNASVDAPAVRDDLHNLSENQFSNYSLPLSSGNLDGTNTINLNSGVFSGWDRGESSSRTNPQERIHGDDLKIGHAWSSPLSAYEVADSRRSEPSNMFHRETGSSFYGIPPSMPSFLHHNYSSNVNLSGRYNDDSRLGIGACLSPSPFRTGISDHQGLQFGTSDLDIGTSSRNSGYSMGNNEASSSFYKRKAVEGSYGQTYMGGSSSSNPQAESMLRFPSQYNAYNSALVANNTELTNPSFGRGTRGVSSDMFPSLSITESAEEAARNLGSRANFGHFEPDMLDSSMTGIGLTHPSFCSAPHSSMPVSVADPSQSEHPPIHPIGSSSFSRVPGFAGGLVPSQWNGSPDSNLGNSSNSVMLENPFFDSPLETRTLVQDPTNWNGTRTNSSRISNSSSHIGSSSRVRDSIARQNLTAHNQQRIPEHAPWALFPIESEFGGRRGRLSPLPLPPSSSDVVMISSGPSIRADRQPLSRSGMLVDQPGDNPDIRRGLPADPAGRRRLIRQLLTAMWRTQNMRSQDHMIFDAFVDEFAEFHDRHRDMRLDVDNMSYEELLALEERIGNVSTGLSEEIILRFMKQKKHQSVDVGSPSNLEPCCICREDYVAGDDLGTLDCGHEFHTDCIKQWLALKNLCPICKMTALKT